MTDTELADLRDRIATAATQDVLDRLEAEVNRHSPHPWDGGQELAEGLLDRRRILDTEVERKL